MKDKDLLTETNPQACLHELVELDTNEDRGLNGIGNVLALG